MKQRALSKQVGFTIPKKWKLNLFLSQKTTLKNLDVVNYDLKDAMYGSVSGKTLRWSSLLGRNFVNTPKYNI